MMLIQVNTDNHIVGREELVAKVEASVAATLDRFADQITRVEVHLTDENAQKGGNDKRCLMEARLAGMQPVAASHQAGSLIEAVDGAAEKLETMLGRTLDKLGETKGRTSFGGDQTI